MIINLYFKPTFNFLVTLKICPGVKISMSRKLYLNVSYSKGVLNAKNLPAIIFDISGHPIQFEGILEDIFVMFYNSHNSVIRN